MTHGPRREYVDGVAYWKARYAAGGNSGKGSYGRLAEFKAEVINHYIHQRNIDTVVEFGSGDGNQYSLLKVPHYLGLDVSPDAVAHCRKLYAGRKDCNFHLVEELPQNSVFDASMSLDVIFHLVDDVVYEAYMRRLFEHARHAVIIYSSDCDDDGREGSHVRHRRFTAWVAAKRPDWRLVQRIPNRYPRKWLLRQNRSFCDFFIFEPVGPR